MKKTSTSNLKFRAKRQSKDNISKKPNNEQIVKTSINKGDILKEESKVISLLNNSIRSMEDDMKRNNEKGEGVEDLAEEQLRSLVKELGISNYYSIELQGESIPKLNEEKLKFLIEYFLMDQSIDILDRIFKLNKIKEDFSSPKNQKMIREFIEIGDRIEEYHKKTSLPLPFSDPKFIDPVTTEEFSIYEKREAPWYNIWDEQRSHEMIEALKPYEGKIVYLYGIDLISDFGGGGYTPVYLENIERRKMGIFSRDWKINAKIHKINWIDKIDSVSLPYELPIIETKTSSIGIWQIAVLPDEFYNKEKFESLMKRSKIKKEEAIIIKTKI